MSNTGLVRLINEALSSAAVLGQQPYDRRYACNMWLDFRRGQVLIIKLLHMAEI